MSERREVKRKVVIETTPELAFEAVTEARELREWCSDEARTQVRPGGRYEVRWHQGYRAEGEFIELDPPRRAKITWRGTGEPGETTVEFIIESTDGDAIINHADWMFYVNLVAN
ncbi:MAG: SRPBCC domain-containing protein, partial [Candidatus Bipolaricaulia bacterium]